VTSPMSAEADDYGTIIGPITSGKSVKEDIARDFWLFV
jgi:hypothetical protein